MGRHLGRALAGLIAALILAGPCAAQLTSFRPVGAAAATALPANQNFLAGTLTRAGYGGCNDDGTVYATGASIPFSNINYAGTHAASLVFRATGTTTSADGVWKIDSHHCMVPAGTYGAAPGAIVTATYAVTDQNGATGNLNVVAIANRWDVTNIDGGANVDTINSNQFLNVLQGTPGSTGPSMGDKVYLRCGAVIDPAKFDVINATTGILAPGDIRVKRPAYAAQVTEFTTGNGGGAYTAKTLPEGDWIVVTSDCPGGATIRHVQVNGTNQVIQGFSFERLNWELDYAGTNGFGQGTGNLNLGSGATSQSFIRVKNNTFQSTTTVVGQRGQRGVFSTSVNDNGASGCTSATIAYFDNVNGPQNGSGASAHAVISGGVIASWVQDTQGSNYDQTHSVTPGSAPSPPAAGTWAVVTAQGCATAPTATPNMNGVDIPIGIFGNSGAGGIASTEVVIADNHFAGLATGVQINGNQNVAFTTPTNFWLTGNSFDSMWVQSSKFANAAPVYTEWNFSTNMKYASGAFHTDCEQRIYTALVDGSTYPFGYVKGNICARGQGTPTFADASGWFSSDVPTGSTAILSGCVIEGNTYVGTYSNGITLDNCDDTALVSFNVLVQDPVAGVNHPNQNGSGSTSNAPNINKYAQSAAFNGESSYNAVAGAGVVWTGGSPTNKCNVASLGLGSSVASGLAYTAPPADFTTLQSVAAVQAAFGTKPGGTLVSANLGGGCPYNAGNGGYFNYVNRVNTAPF